MLAVTNDEESNLAIAIAVRLLNPKIPVIARARSPSVKANMASFGTDYIINPFERFAEHLALAISAPERFRLIELLTNLPELPIPEIHRPPRGRWILCGYGHFGQAVAEHLRPTGIDLTIIDPQSTAADQNIAGNGTEARTLLQARIHEAAGIIAGSYNDVNNLSIAVTATELNPALYVVTRQNHTANTALFDAFSGDFSMVPSRIVAQECIAILTTPLLAGFLQRLQDRDESWCRHLVERLHALSEGLTPTVWSIRLNATEAPAARQTLMHHEAFSLKDILRDGTDRSRALPAIPLLVERADSYFLLPDERFPLAAGDQILLASTMNTRRNLELTLRNPNELYYVLNGHERSQNWLWQKLNRQPLK